MSLGKTCRDLIMEYPFIGLFMTGVNRVITNETETLDLKLSGINFDILINPSYWDSLSPELKKGAFYHEMLHLAFGHPLYAGDYTEKELYKIATDIEINQHIPSDWVGKDWLTLQKLNAALGISLGEKKGSHYYYNELLKILPNNQPLQNMCSNMQGGNGKNNPNGKGQGSNSPGNNKPDEHDEWASAEKVNETTQKLAAQQLDYQLKAAAESCKDRGYLPAELQNYIEKLYELPEEKFNWKAYFRRFTGCTRDYKTKKTRRKQSKRFSGSPGLRIIQKKKIFIALDTSGSVSDHDFKEMMSEVAHAHKTGVEITICHSDAAVAHVEKFDPKKDYNRHGYGGTDFDPAIKYFNHVKDDYSAMIYFTDGLCTPPNTKPGKPILWVISSNGQILDGLPGFQIKLPA